MNESLKLDILAIAAHPDDIELKKRRNTCQRTVTW
jgi:LmbE family N-acetylglucosaminyl deacetylase